MCGIAGEVRWGAAPGARAEDVLATVLHRGPDSIGAFARDDGWVGQTRLAIIDVPGGDPPIANEDGSIGVALNGEIYNFRELRAELRERGHEFATSCDTEVVVHLAEELDPVALAARLEGMFAVAVWDAPRRRLVLARDRFGKKPLYYWHDGTRLVFGSEIKAVLANPAVPRRLREAAIPDYLTFGYVPTPGTFYEGIRSVPPGHVLVAEDGAEPRIEPYWRLGLPGVDAGATRLELSFDAAAAEVRRLLRAAVHRRLVADVPLGAFLSGGIDSSAVVALMAEAGRVSTFTIGFDDSDGFDERPYARAVARRYDTDHTEFVVAPNAADLVERLVWHHDQPFGDSSALPTFLLSELTAGHVKVALCGDGGDELFGGYERFAAALALARYEAVPDLVRTAIRRGAQRAAPLARRSGRLAKARRALLRSDRDPAEGLLAWISYVSEESKAELVGDARSAGMDAYKRIWAQSAGAHPLDRLLDLNIRTYLLDDLLPKVDRMSMAHGLEVRAPFLDRELAEHAIRLPPSARVRGLQLKRVLRAAVADLLPAEVLQRPKRGFGIPLDRWFREDLEPLVTGTLGAADSRIGAYVSRDAVRAMLAAHARGAANHGHALWTLLTLELFLRDAV
ncbi:MAG TPA: asparagine synthase (glutamine-hydrolyzing) [Solirubrobacteraceae bacterium]|nr:asparagine synthase (glutamine-hydrolyzing) [Solirubrobacteraceae bacterium]